MGIMMAPTDDWLFKCSYPSLEPRCFRRADHLSQVSSRTYCDTLWVGSYRPVTGTSCLPYERIRFYPCTIVLGLYSDQRFRCLPRGHRTSYSRLALLGQLSAHRVRLNDPSNRAFLRHPVVSLASRPSEEQELAPLVHIVRAAFSPSVAQPKATPVAIRSLGEDLNPTKETSFASGNVSDEFLVAP